LFLRFLHASLQLEALRECINAKEVRHSLNAFPSKIGDVYLYTWDRILNDRAEHVSLVKAVLIWVLYAKSSMTIEELRMAATSLDTHKFEADLMVPPSTLLSLCRGLITMEEKSGLVRLVREWVYSLLLLTLK
jgi:ankyrin repeat domain-containing protein 50